MKKGSCILIAMLCLSLSASSQITKNNWMVGGSGSYRAQKQKLESYDVEGTHLKIAPNIGYFFIDKFAAGLTTTVDFSRIVTGNIKDRTTSLGVGPFVRYYFLPVDRRVNLFSEATYQYNIINGSNNSHLHQHTYSFSAGPVVYFNSSVGLEFALGYEALKGNSSTTSVKTILFDIGLQIHLERE